MHAKVFPLHGDGAKDNSNFNQLLHVRVLDDPNLLTWVQRKAKKYTSPENQNEILKVTAQSVTRDIASTVGSSGFYSLMADEVTDASNIEQVAICLRNIDDNFDAHEDLVGMYAVESIKGDILVQVLKDTPFYLLLTAEDNVMMVLQTWLEHDIVLLHKF